MRPPRASSPSGGLGEHGRSVVLRRTAVFIGLIVLLALVASSDGLHAALVRLSERAGAVISERPVAGAALFVLFSALSAMVVFLTSSVLVPPALLAWGEARTVMLLWFAWILGAAMAYAVARRLGRPAVVWLMSRRPLELYEKRIPRHAPVGLVLLFQLALPSEIVGYVLGLARYPFGKYIVAAALAELPYALGVTYLGATMLQRRILPLVAIGAVGVLLTLVAVRALRGRLPAERGHPSS